MFIAINRFQIVPGKEKNFEEVWRNRDTHLEDVPGFSEFHLVKGKQEEDHTLYASHTVWDSNEKFIYVGIAGTNAEFDERKPQSRIKQHSSGYRSGDQFCVYVHDFYVLPIIFAKKQYTPIKRELDKLTKDYIHNNFHYRFVDFQTKNSNIIVKKIEDDIKSGSFGIKPELNGKWEFAK